MLENINIFAVIASVVMGMVIGSVWYSPSVFGKQWMEAMSKMPKDSVNSGTNMKKLYGIQLLISFVGAYSLAYIIAGMGLVSISSAIITGIVMSVGIVATNAYGSVLWGHSSRDAFLISTGGNIITMVVMTLILTIWQ